MEQQHKNDLPEEPPAANSETDAAPSNDPASPQGLPKEIGGRDGPEPTRYGDWEKNGRCIDF